MQVNGLMPVTYFSIVEYTRNGSVFPEIFLDLRPRDPISKGFLCVLISQAVAGSRRTC